MSFGHYCMNQTRPWSNKNHTAKRFRTVAGPASLRCIAGHETGRFHNGDFLRRRIAPRRGCWPQPGQTTSVEPMTRNCCARIILAEVKWTLQQFSPATKAERSRYWCYDDDVQMGRMSYSVCRVLRAAATTNGSWGVFSATTGQCTFCRSLGPCTRKVSADWMQQELKNKSWKKKPIVKIKKYIVRKGKIKPSVLRVSKAAWCSVCSE